MSAQLRDLVPYEVPSCDNVIKLDANENSYYFPRPVMEAINDAVGAQTFNRYPDAETRYLREAISSYTGVDVNGIMAGNGSDELIFNLLLTFASGGKVAITTPTFGMYRIHSIIAGAEPVSVPRRAGDFAVDVPAVCEAAASPETKVTVVCSPNNPTGNITSLEDIEAVLRAARGLVIIDEAYFEFCGETVLPLLDRYPNLVVLRTFSKAFGLAGLRVGYMLADPAVVQAVRRVKQPFNLNAYSQIAAAVVLSHLSVFKKRIRAICRARDRLLPELAKIPGVECYPSRANFILFRTPLKAADIFQGLLARGILIRNMDSPDLRNCLRVTVGQPEENRLFLQALAEVLNR
ncbi:MAG: histidinol-phosphate transaminase [Peptococcaceae bacterium]|nr:histidinol-phosphate transaminase [Peptococcaceae bacterium]